MSAPRWAVGMRRLGPGVYIDPKGNAHLSGVELCEALNVEPTPENIRVAEESAVEAFRASFGVEIPFVRVEEPHS